MYHCRECFCYCRAEKVNCPFYRGHYDGLELAEIEEEAKNGEFLAELYLAVCKIHGERVPKNTFAGIATLKKLAQKAKKTDPSGSKSALAKGFLSLCYFDGKGVLKNPKKAFRLCKEAAGHGCHQHEKKMYECYKDGIGTNRDLTSADEWKEFAGVHGNEEHILSVADSKIWGKDMYVLEAIRLYKIADKLEIPQARERIMYCYRNYYRKIIGELTYEMAEKGNAEYQLKVGDFYLEDPYAYDPKEAVEWYHKAAVQGNKEASLVLGRLYYEGKHLPRDLGLAHWYCKQIYHWDETDALRSEIEKEELAHLGKDEDFFVTPAERTRLALYYLEGKEIGKDLLRAKQLLQEGENGNSVYALEKLGEIYYFGLLDSCDYKKAFDYLSKAWAMGSRMAAGILAGCYYNGYGVQKDQSKAQELLCKVFFTKAMWRQRMWYSENERYEKMKNGTYPDEMRFAANLLGVSLFEKDAKLTFACYAGAAKKGHMAAFANLGYCYEHGHGCEKSQEMSIECYRKGAEGENKHAQYMLGTCYMEGRGVERDEAEGLRLLICAANQDYFPAIEKLGDCYLNGSGAPLNVWAAMECYRRVYEAGYTGIEEKMRLCLARDLKDSLPKKYQSLLERAQEKEPVAQREFGLLFWKGDHVPKDMEMAEKWLCQAAEQGDTEALLLLADAYSKGKPLSQNLTKAAIYYEKAAEKGDVGAKSRLARCFFYGNGVKKDYDRAFKLYQEAAMLGESSAYHGLGLCYSHGYGTVKNSLEAVKWVEKGARAGDAEAQCTLGWHYYYCEGVAQNLPEAVKWFKLSAEQGEVPAMCNLGYCFCTGTGIAQNYTEGIKWFTKAAEKGDARACYYLGVCYYDGKGITKDHTEAVKWFTKGAEKGDAYACCYLGICYYNGHGVKSDYQEAFKLFKQAEEKKIALAQYYIGLCYYYGRGVQVNGEEAFRYFEAAVKQGNCDAMAMLGSCYFEGKGTPVNYSEAVRWNKQAAEKGSTIGMSNLGDLYENGHGVKKSLTEAKTWYQKSLDQGYLPATRDLQRVQQKMEEECRYRIQEESYSAPATFYETSSGYSTGYSTGYSSSPYGELDYDSPTAFLNRCLRDDLDLSSSERERELVRERYRSKYPDTIFYEDYPSSSYSEPLDDHDYLSYLNDIM